MRRFGLLLCLACAGNDAPTPSPDAGVRPDAAADSNSGTERDATHDRGVTDAGPRDVGRPQRDAGQPDIAQPDPPQPDAPTPDAAPPDLGPRLPPDPATVAPPLPEHGIAPFADSVAFLYAGSEPTQTGVAEGSIDVQRVAVVRGRVRERDGGPLAGVRVFVPAHPEFGQTLTREDVFSTSRSTVVDR